MPSYRRYIRLFLISSIVIFCLAFFDVNVVMKNASITHPIHKTLLLDEKFNDYEVDAIEMAAKDWERATNKRIIFSIVRNVDINYPMIKDYDDEILINKIYEADPQVPQLDKEHESTVIAYCRKAKITSITIIYERASDDDIYEKVVEHELGHAIGIKHLSDRNAVMYPYILDNLPILTKIDTDAFCEVYNCS